MFGVMVLPHFLACRTPNTRVRGLKSVVHIRSATAHTIIAPHTGAWIETPWRYCAGLSRVAPHTGAWIEIILGWTLIH